jgi:polyhydroxyalkanoate synthesis regulator phasin
MQRDAWRTYLELALGLTEASRKKAKKAIKSLVNQSGASVDQVRSLTEELVETSLANREAIAKLVRGELDRALGLVGLASSEEVAELNDRIADLERRLRAAEAGTTDGKTDGKTGGTTGGAAGTAEPAGDVLSAGRAAVKKAAARKATTTAATSPAKVAAKKAATTRTAAGTAKTAAAKKTTAKKTTAKKTTAKKTTAKKAVAKKAPAKQAPAEATPDTPEAGNTQ